MTTIAGLDGVARARRGGRLGTWWVLGLLLCLFVLVPLVASALRSTPRASDGLPERIAVHGRDYDHGGPLTDAEVAAQRGTWTSIGHVWRVDGVVDDVGRRPGMTVMGLVVERPDRTYVTYSLVGGP